MIIMLKELFEKYLKRKKEVGPEVVQVVETEPKEEFDITISRDDHVLKVEISDYVKMVDYYERMKEIDDFNLLDLICNAVLWNGQRQRVNKGSYYVIMHDCYLYNVFFGEEETIIDERVKVDEDTIQKHITLHHDGDYNYTHFKHNKELSTYYTKYYSKKGFPIKNFELSKEEAYEGISGLLNRFELVPGSSDILDVNIFRNNVLDDLVPYDEDIKKASV